MKKIFLFSVFLFSSLTNAHTHKNIHVNATAESETSASDSWYEKFLLYRNLEFDPVTIKIIVNKIDLATAEFTYWENKIARYKINLAHRSPQHMSDNEKLHKIKELISTSKEKLSEIKNSLLNVNQAKNDTDVKDKIVSFISNYFTNFFELDINIDEKNLLYISLEEMEKLEKSPYLLDDEDYSLEAIRSAVGLVALRDYLAETYIILSSPFLPNGSWSKCLDLYENYNLKWDGKTLAVYYQETDRVRMQISNYVTYLEIGPDEQRSVIMKDHELAFQD